MKDKEKRKKVGADEEHHSRKRFSNKWKAFFLLTSLLLGENKLRSSVVSPYDVGGFCQCNRSKHYNEL